MGGMRPGREHRIPSRVKKNIKRVGGYVHRGAGDLLNKRSAAFFSLVFFGHDNS